MSKNVTKRDLVVRIAEETGIVQQQVLNVVQRTLNLISETVARGETVELRNFGVFEVKVRKARVGRNPNAPATDVPIPPRAVVKFKPGKEMKEAVLLGGQKRQAATSRAEKGAEASSVRPAVTPRAPMPTDGLRATA